MPCPHIRAEQSFAVALPELDGPVSMGIFSTDGNLVRSLYRDALIDSIPAGLNGLIMTWDEKDAQGRHVPAGTYTARGLVHGPIRISTLPVSDRPHPACTVAPLDMPPEAIMPTIVLGKSFPGNRIWIRAAKDELLESRPLLAIVAEADGSGCLLKADGLPFARFPMEGNRPVASLSLSNGRPDGSAELTVERGHWVEKYSLSGLHRLVPLNAGALEVSADAFHLVPVAGESAP